MNAYFVTVLKRFRLGDTTKTKNLKLTTLQLNLLMKDLKFNIPVLIFSAIMIAASSLNYLLGKDSVSLGISIFLGLGFAALSTQPKDNENTVLRKRLNRYAVYFFSGSMILIGYWILAAKLRWI
jgi:hypothetical protein